VQTAGSMTDAEQFRNIVIRSLPDGSVVRVRGRRPGRTRRRRLRVRVAPERQAGVAMGVYLRPGANALGLAKALETKMNELTRVRLPR